MDQKRPSFSGGRKWGIGFSVAVSILSLFAVVVLLNLISARHYHRWNSRRTERLSPQTVRVLTAITNSVKIIIYYDRREALFNTVSQMLEQYKQVCPRLDIQYIDYRYPGRAEAVRNQYKLGSDTEENRIIFDCDGKAIVVPAKELSIYDFSKIGTGEDIPRTGFKGEQLFTSAILNVVEGKNRLVYFLTGHGEHDPKAEDDQRGYSKFATLLERNNLGIRKLLLVGTNVPEDCQLLIIAGPQKAFDPQEIEQLEKYLNQGGRMFVLFNSFAQTNKTGLERLLAKWNLEVGSDFVRDEPQGQAQNRDSLYVTHFGAHPIVNPLLNYGLSLVLPRSISQRPNAVQSADAPKVVELAFTSASGVAVTPLSKTERRGAIPMMAAIEKGNIQGLGADKGAARIVVTGDSFFLVNYVFDYASNEDFANLAVNWLLNRDKLLGDIGPRATREYKLIVTESQFSRLRWIFLIGVPGSVLLIGFCVWLKRRH
jgi:hypothetical protein